MLSSIENPIGKGYADSYNPPFQLENTTIPRLTEQIETSYGTMEICILRRDRVTLYSALPIILGRNGNLKYKIHMYFERKWTGWTLASELGERQNYNKLSIYKEYGYHMNSSAQAPITFSRPLVENVSELFYKWIENQEELLSYGEFVHAHNKYYSLMDSVIQFINGAENCRPRLDEILSDLGDSWVGKDPRHSNED